MRIPSRAPAIAAWLLIAGASVLPAPRIPAQGEGAVTPPRVSQETRERVRRLLEQGDMELEFGLINGALFYYDQAWQLLEADPAVAERLHKAADFMIRNAPPPGDRDGLEVYLRDIESMMAREGLRDYGRLIEQRAAAEQTFAAIAEQCGGSNVD